MNDNPVWEAIRTVAEIKSRIAMAEQNDDIRPFIKDYIIKHKDDSDIMWRFVFIIRNEYPQYKDYLEKVLVLL